ncbi:hypothetical protein D8674_039947 [Pyrus ussuriensis x Pyrus communis]|uniref:Uncharacterized protein n=1 Tax=Pyrus ussuriensis x Pyrus communis TaxID=2448454 RepID=A0A5N5GXG9_9ROSA|nr:hypothetical protein D8674_039947 [Pyrus ussuriensis x Pyrus communis]
MESSTHVKHQEGHVVVVMGPRLGLLDLARANGWLDMGRRSGMAWTMVWAATSFNFSISIDEVIEYGVAKIGATEDKVSSEQTTECEVAGNSWAVCPIPLKRKPRVVSKNWFILPHWKAYPDGCQRIGLTSCIRKLTQIGVEELACYVLMWSFRHYSIKNSVVSNSYPVEVTGFVARATTWAARLDQSQRLARHGQKQWYAVIEDDAAKIKDTEDEVLSEQIAKCEVATEGIMDAFVLWALGPWWSLPPFSKATWDLYRLWLFDVVTCASGTAFEPAKRCLSGDGNDPPERAGGCIVDWFLDGSSKTLCSEMELHVLNPFQALNSKLQATGPRDSKPSNKLLAWFEPKTGVDDVGLARELAQGCLREAQPLAGFSFWTKGISPAYWAGFVVASRG